MNLISCYRLAWAGFSRWWIPLCLVALIGVLAETAPRFMAQREAPLPSLAKSGSELLAARSEHERVERSRAILAQLQESGLRMGRWALLFAPIAIPVTILLIVFGMKATSREGLELGADTRLAGRRGLAVLLSQVLALGIAFGPVVLWLAGLRFLGEQLPGQVALLLLIALPTLALALGLVAVLYVVFFFAPQLAADSVRGPLGALFMSARLVWIAPVSTSALVAINALLQILSIPTVIGLIPVTAFVNTARGAAYQQLLAEHRAASGDEEQSQEFPVAN